jgi:hypothetical protein
MKTGKEMTDNEQTMITLTGRVKRRREYSLQELLSMDTFETGEQLLACGSGEPKRRIKGCRGVLLTDLINGAEVLIEEHNDTKKFYVVVSSKDSYYTVFSWQELFNTSVGEGVMVILEKDGHKVYEERGSLDLFSAQDFLIGPRYVKQAKEVRIIMAEHALI